MQPLCRILLAWFTLAHTAIFLAQSVPYIAFRSQAVNAARHMVGWNREINRPSEDEFSFSFNVTTEYTQSFNAKNIAHCLFGDDIVCNDCTSTINISGYDIPYRGSTDWFAPYFGLPLDFQSSFSIKPSNENFIVDFGLYVGLDHWLDGLYLRLQGPFVYNRRRLNFNELIQSFGINENVYPQGWYGPDRIPGNEFNGESSVMRNQLNTNFTTYITGHAPQLPDEILWQQLAFARFYNDCNRGPMLTTAFGELQMILGWNFLAKENYHLGIGALAAAPTGTRPNGEYVFQPVVGNGKHWELGAQITGHVLFLNNEETDTSYGLYMEAYITHLFKARQTRTFDICGKPNSRYMLAEKLGTLRLNPHLENPAYPYITTDDYQPTDADAGVEFQNEFAPVANITTLRVNSTIKIQADIALMFEYQSGGFQGDIGYNFWGRTCETICPDPCCSNPFPENTWALKGDAFVVGFEGTLNAINPATDRLPVRLAATDSKATIHSGSKGNVNPPSNSAADSPAYAFTNDVENLGMGFQELPVMSRTNESPTDPSLQAFSSSNPIYISQANLNFAGTRGISNKLFLHLNYTWIEKEAYWFPYCGVGGEIEFGTRSSGDDDGCCKEMKIIEYKNKCCGIQSCHDCAMSQWGLWLKVGLSYR